MAALKTFLLVGLLSLGLLAGCDRLPGASQKPSFKAVDITGAEYARQLSLPDADGKPRTLADFKGKVTLVFFGYTQCPDVCPTTLAELAAVKRDLGKDGERLQGVFVSVDPQRDTPEILKAYMASFDPGFVALRGTPEQIKDTAKEFKVFYAQVPGKTEGSYTVDHTAGTYVFDASGKVRLFVRYGSGAEALRHDLKLLLDENPA
ncbi:MAG: SCO family protein [Burkholderiales bacterium]|jgi:protein SCO1/2|nr:SCO family protein [Burkholderiales bacterium]